jgi:hypothetical protein
MHSGHEPTRVHRARPLRLMATGLALAFATTCGSPPAITDRGYELVFDEQFDGDEVRPHWATAPFGGSLPGTVQDGLLTLRSTAANDYHWGYLATTGPRFETEPNYPFASAWEEGYFEARLRFTDDPWAWPAFWLFSMAKTEAWPGEDCTKLNAEWDIMENGVGSGQASSWFVSVLHRNTTNNTPDGYCATPDEMLVTREHFPDTDLSAWHIWAGRWTAGELCTYLDGVEIECVEPFDTTAQPMHIVLTINYLGECPGCPATRPANLEMQVDWVRVWQPA